VLLSYYLCMDRRENIKDTIKSLSKREVSPSARGTISMGVSTPSALVYLQYS
jgi:hypothetical protein